MLNALRSQPLFLDICLACHLLFQYTCWVRHVLTLAITTSSRARSVWGVSRGYSGLLGVRSPQSATCGVGVSAARINVNWNAYLFILWLSAWFVINLTSVLYGIATVIHYCRHMCVIWSWRTYDYLVGFIHSKLGVTLVQFFDNEKWNLILQQE